MNLTTRSQYVEVKNLISKIKKHGNLFKINSIESNIGINVLEKLYEWFEDNSFELLNCLELEYNEWSIWFERLSYDVSELYKLIYNNAIVERVDLKEKMSKIASDYQRLKSLEEVSERRSLDLKKRKEKIEKDTHSLEVEINSLRESLKRISVNIRNLENDSETILKTEKKNYDDQINSLKENYKNQVDSMLKEFAEDKNKMYNDLNLLRSDVEDALCNFKNSINKEELAQFFLDERLKIKGDLSFSLKGFSALFTPYWMWLIATLVGMVLIGIFAFHVFSTAPGTDWHTMLSRIPLFAILIWFTWFCSKQFSYMKQVCDEYEYKYALSKSYLSYRDEANKLAEKAGKDVLLASLLYAVIKNIATSPVQSVKSDCHTPFAEALKAFEPMAKKVKNEEDKFV